MSTKEKFNDRYLNPDKLNSFLKGLKNIDDLSIIGYSEENRPIYGVKMGVGPNKILLWSQMHGNETTTTKALCALFSLLENSAHANLLSQVSLFIIPQLNPDGAAIYIRLNSNSIDLNRDAIDLSQSESRVLLKIFKKFNPDYCFNLHGQRTIYSAGNMGLPATVSFLAPSGEPGRAISKSMSISMKIIAAINKSLQIDLPGQVGRYHDLFNLDCVGDRFSSFGVPTILFEAGHYPGDYNRNITSKYILKVLIEAIKIISSEDYKNYTTDQYFKIPENSKDYSDLLITDTPILHRDKLYKNQDLVINYKEILINSKVEFIPYMTDYSNLWAGLGHKTISFKEIKLDSSFVYFEKNIPFKKIQQLIYSLLNIH